MVRLLLSYGADPTVLDDNGERPLSLASEKHTKSAYNDALFASIAQHEYICVNTKSKLRNFHAIIQFFFDSMRMTEKLFISSNETNIRDNSEKLNSLLHWAVSFNNKEAIHFLAGKLYSILLYISSRI